MWMELFFAINRGVLQIWREGDSRRVIFGLESSRVLKNG